MDDRARTGRARRWRLLPSAGLAVLIPVAVAAATGAGGGDATMALGGSLVYVRAHDLWIAAPDGSAERRLTQDGAPGAAYHDPTQVPDGSILAIRGEDLLVHLSRDGIPLSEPVRLAVLENGAEGLVVAPSGDRVAYATTGYGTEVDPRFGTPTGIFLYGGTDVALLDGTSALDAAAAGVVFPDWLSDGRLAASDGVDLYLYEPGVEVPETWLSFTDGCLLRSDCQGGGTAYATLSQPVTSPDDRLLAYTYAPFFGDAGRRIASLGAGNPPDVETICTIPGQEHALTPLTFSPDGHAVAWDDGRFDPDRFESIDAQGVWVMALDLAAADCGRSEARMILPGATQPEWGPTPP